MTGDSSLDVERGIPRDQRQAMISSWAESAFGHVEATSIPHRGLRLLEEAIEAFQACGGHEELARQLVRHVFGCPPGKIGQEIGGVAVTLLALAAAAGLSAEEEECREIQRVRSRPLAEFTARNAVKNGAGFRLVGAPGVPVTPESPGAWRSAGLVRCRRCNAADVVYRTHESSCGGYEDPDEFRCSSCHHTWWVDGPDS